MLAKLPTAAQLISQEDLLEYMVSLSSYRQDTMTVKMLHGRTFHILERDVDKKGKSEPEVLYVNDKLATHKRSIH